MTQSTVFLIFWIVTLTNCAVNCSSISFAETQQINFLEDLASSSSDENAERDSLNWVSGIENSNAKIVGGVETTPNEFPWQAFVQITYLNGTIRSCSGTLIAEQWILTAAYCVVTVPNNFASLRVLLGAHNLTANEINQEEYEGAKVHFLSSWNPNFSRDDVALVQLKTNVTYSNYIRPIILARSDESNHLNDMVVVSGWGINSNSSTATSSTLRKVTVSVISNSDCAKVYGNTFVTERVICSSGVDSKGPCYGDNGGPMIYQQYDGTWNQIGVSSFYSSNGCQDGNPSGFMRISFYRRWIESVTGPLPLQSTTTSSSISTTSTIIETSTMPSAGRIQTSAHLLLSVIAVLFIIIIRTKRNI